MNIITSKSNKDIKNTKKLLQKKYRKAAYLIEGWHLLEEALSSGANIKKVYLLEEYIDRVPDSLETVVVTPDVLKELSDSKTPQGVVAQIELPQQILPEQVSGRVLILEDVQDPGNVGTIIRTADAANYDAVLMTTQSADLFNPKTLRSMQGSHFHLPIYRAPIDDILDLIKSSQLTLMASTLSDQSIDFKAVNTKDNFALVLGNEGQGISEKMTSSADQLIHITMPGQAESLNVAVAAGILIFSFI